MKKPSYEALAQIEPGHVHFCGTYMHPNPRWFKYYWWVFSDESPVEGKAFLTEKYRLCFHDAMELRKRLVLENKVCMLYNERHPRRGTDTPFNPNHPKFKDTEWAPSYDEDTDPVLDGFK